MDDKKYLASKLEEIQNDIQDWTRALVLLDENPNIKAHCLPQYNDLKKKVEDWQKLQTALVDLYHNKP